MENLIEGNFFQISNQFVALKILILDSHKGLLINPFLHGYMHVASYFEDVRFQFDHHKL